MSAEHPELSIVVPVYNEAMNIERLATELVAALEQTGRTFEIVAVDDGSRDASFPMLCAVQAQDPRWRVVRLLRNFGQSPALYAGFSVARGAVVATFDADLQTPASEIEKVVSHLLEGDYDEVQGVRQLRRDAAYRRVLSKAMNGVMARLLRTEMRDLGTGLKAYRKSVIGHLIASTHHSRYVPAETAWLGIRVGSVPIEHRERVAGVSKYSLFSLFRAYFDMIASVSTAPVQLVAGAGGLCSILGFGMAIHVAYIRIVHGDINQLSSVVALFFLLTGVQMLATGILAEYLSRIYREVQGRPYFIIDRVVENQE